MSLSKTRYLPILADGMPDEGIKSVYDKLEEEGSLRWLFFDGCCTSYEQFLSLVRRVDFYTVVDTKDNSLVSVFWLNGRTGINCTVHTAFFKQYYRRSVKISQELIRWTFEAFPKLESLLCFIPVTNRLANKFVEKVGWIKVGTVPNLIKDAKTSQSIGGDMYYITKGEV